jgi:hypothetical protein
MTKDTLAVFISEAGAVRLPLTIAARIFGPLDGRSYYALGSFCRINGFRYRLNRTEKVDEVLIEKCN